MAIAGLPSESTVRVGYLNSRLRAQERVARLIHERRIAPTIIVFPYCFTALGCNQYVNSSASGNYADYLTKYATAADAMLAGGFILAEDIERLKASSRT